MNRTNFLLAVHGAQFSGQILGFFPQPRDDRPLRFEKGDDDEPDGEDHQEAHGQHVINEFEEADILTGELLEHAGRGHAPGGAQEGDDGAGAGGPGHADEQALAEPGGLVGFAVQGIDGQQQREDGRGHRGVGHDQGHGAHHQEGPQQNQIGSFPHDGEHLVGHALGETRGGKGGADDHGAENEPDGGVQEVAQGFLGSPDKEEHLEQADGNGGDADGHNLKDPPDTGHEKEADGHLAGPGQLKDLSPRINRIRQTGNEIKQEKDSKTQEDKYYAFLVNHHLFGGKMISSGISGRPAPTGIFLMSSAMTANSFYVSKVPGRRLSRPAPGSRFH